MKILNYITHVLVHGGASWLLRCGFVFLVDVLKVPPHFLFCVCPGTSGWGSRGSLNPRDRTCPGQGAGHWKGFPHGQLRCKVLDGHQWNPVIVSEHIPTLSAAPTKAGAASRDSASFSTGGMMRQSENSINFNFLVFFPIYEDYLMLQYCQMEGFCHMAREKYMKVNLLCSCD